MKNKPKKKNVIHCVFGLVLGVVVFFCCGDKVINAYKESEDRITTSDCSIYKLEEERVVVDEEEFGNKYFLDSAMSIKAVTLNPYYGRYGYSQLHTDEEKNTYQLLEKSADVFHQSGKDATGSETTSSSETIKYTAISVPIFYDLTEAEAKNAVVCFLYDHPEYFWTEGYSYFVGETTKKVLKINLACHKDYANGEQREQLRQEIEKEIEAYMDLIVGVSTDYEKELILHNALAERTSYVYGEDGKAKPDRWAHTIEGVFSENREGAVCEGYAKAFQVLLNAAGIENVYVVGKSRGQGHAWNQVKIEEEWYNVDITWNDTGDRKSYRYFNVKDSVFSTSHVPFSSTVVPKVGEWCYPTNVCTSDKYSYTNMGDTISQDKFLVGIGNVEGAKVKILNQGVVVADSSSVTCDETWVASGTALRMLVDTDYTKGEQLFVTIGCQGEKTTLTGNAYDEKNLAIKQQDCSFVYDFVLKEDTVVDVSVYVPIANIDLSKQKITLYGKNDKEEIKAQIFPESATTPNVSWKSSKPEVATVKNGIVKSVAPGKTTIYAYAEDGTVMKKCQVTVKKPCIKINQNKKTVKVGETLKFTGELLGKEGNILWFVSNKKKASINTKTGKFKAKKAGTVWVIAECGNITKKIKIKIKK